MNSYFQATSSERFVTVWPGSEPGFYDVAYGPVKEDEADPNRGCRTVHRVTAYEAAAYIGTEVGIGLGVTLAGLEQQIRDWRAEYDTRPTDNTCSNHDNPECNTCGGTGDWESTTEESPTELVYLGDCPDCDNGHTACQWCGWWKEQE